MQLMYVGTRFLHEHVIMMIRQSMEVGYGAENDIPVVMVGMIAEGKNMKIDELREDQDRMKENKLQKVYKDFNTF